MEMARTQNMTFLSSHMHNQIHYNGLHKQPKSFIFSMSYRDSSLNQNGRAGSDSRNKGIQFLHCKMYLLIGTTNGRILMNKGKCLELAINSNKCKLNSLDVVNQKIVHRNDPMLIEKLDSCSLIMTSPWKNFNGAAGGGLGIVANSKAEKRHKLNQSTTDY